MKARKLRTTNNRLEKIAWVKKGASDLATVSMKYLVGIQRVSKRLRRFSVIRLLFYLTWLLLCFAIYWFWVKPLLPMLGHIEWPELNYWSTLKWGFPKFGVGLVFGLWMWYNGMRFIDKVSEIREHKKWKKLIVPIVLSFGAICLAAFLSKVASDFAGSRIFGGILPDVSIWGFIALESTLFTCGVMGSLSSSQENTSES